MSETRRWHSGAAGLRMLNFLLDTNICIYAIKKRSDNIRRAFTENEDRMAISCVTLMELIYGAEKSQEPERNLADIESFASRLALLTFDSKAAMHAGQVRAELERKGMPIGGYDLMIGGHARAEGLILVTNNTRELKRVAGLRIENWT